MTTQTILSKTGATDYSGIEQLPDPPREPDMVQFRELVYFAAALMPRYRHRDDVLVTGQMYLVVDAGGALEFYPDGIFAEGVGDPERIVRRNGYVISEVGKPPDFVLEVGSRSTGERDYMEKRDGYARYGVREYWRFDPSGGEYHDAALAGDVLVGSAYVPLEITVEPDGRHWGYSEALGLELWWEEGGLRFRDPESGEFLPTPQELSDEVETERGRVTLAQAEVEMAQARAESERGRADMERAARERAEARMAEMEAELRRLRC